MTTPLDRPSTPNGAEGEPARSEPTGESFPQIPGFKTLRQLGQGGMGVVYKAHQESLNRVVALKVVSPALAADRELVKRFGREARAMAQLNHPNIVTIYGVGEVAGLPYIVMEYVSGKSLQDMLRREPYLPPQRAISIALQAGEALLYAHQNGVLHRDVKPSNILIEDDLDRVKVSDFGLAKILGEEGSFVTETGDILGTLAYMSPGVAAGEPPSEASDVYALGVILYEMLSGKRPYEGQNQLALMRSIIQGRPKALPVEVQSIPEGVTRVVHRAIGRDRRRQHIDMQTFLEDLLECTPAAPVAARGRETTVRIMARIATLDFLVLFLVIGSSFYWVARRTRQELMQQMYKQARLVADTVLARRADDAKNLRTFDLLPIQFPHPLHQSSLEQRGFRWRHIYQAGTFEPSQPPGKVEQPIPRYQARDEWEQYFLDSWAKPETRRPVDRRTRDPITRQRLYHWLTPVTAEESCLTCHSDFAPGSFQGMLSVELPFDRERRELFKTRWLMVASAVVTVVVALATLYVLTYFLILKPLRPPERSAQSVEPSGAAAQTATLLPPRENGSD